MKNNLPHTVLFVIVVTLIIMAAGRDWTYKNYNSNAVKKEAVADAGSYFDLRHFLTPLSRFY
ncbi:hypothetical protein QWZ08_14730 [Ferruginibacter paludis]|uniref:hypothetical protein n=1 Tax=Ferruginibacter paludis TaxID=1310417 RepID=UPI0025B46613|nr:hypothetical protein [Ferruginibacter paludis]MDN3656900.1 hypothetical protein [Ferruginibacter paludis]